jgi:hypothetical protein
MSEGAGTGRPVAQCCSFASLIRSATLCTGNDGFTTSASGIEQISESQAPAGKSARVYQTLGLYNFAVAHADLPDDLVYNVVRTVFENRTVIVPFAVGGTINSVGIRSAFQRSRFAKASALPSCIDCEPWASIEPSSTRAASRRICARPRRTSSSLL